MLQTTSSVSSSAQTPLEIKSLSVSKGKLVAETRSIENLGSLEIERMYQLYSNYYENHSYLIFTRDLFEKDHVIILRDRSTAVIQGFSTLMKVELELTDKKVFGVYSGDTVLNKNYWGSKALGIEFLKYMWIQRMKRPTQPLYWFLISKGYKTYMQMANNFLIHYPRYEKSTPETIQEIMSAFYSKKFGRNYDASRGLVKFDENSCRLKNTVAPISPDNLKNPKISHFQKLNPDWTQGVELTCIAEMTTTMPMSYVLKKIFKGLFV